MVRYVVAVLCLLVGAYAADEPCSKQMEAEVQCMITLKSSPEAQKLKDAIKNVMKTCAPSIPETCHAQMEATHDCATDLAKGIESNDALKGPKKEAEEAVDSCFAHHPPSVAKEAHELFMPKMKHHGPPHYNKFRRFGKFHKKHHNDSMSSSEQSSSEEKSSGEATSSESGESSSNETFSGEKKHHGGERKHHRGCGKFRKHHRGGHSGARNATSSSESGSSEKNSSSSGSSSKSGEKKHMKHHKMNPECVKTKEQKKCIFHGLRALGNDTALVDATNNLVSQKRKCKSLVTWSCGDKTKPREWCLFKKTKSFRQAFVKELEACVEKKGFTLPPFLLRTGGDHSKIIEATTPLSATTV